MLTVKETNQKIIKDTISNLIKKGVYKNIGEVQKRNPSLEEFCFNNKINFIMYSFSSQFTNNDYLELLNQLNQEMQLNQNNENNITETNINGNVFVDDKNNNDKTLVGIEEVNTQETSQKTFENEEKFEKNLANFKNINDINVNNLNNEQIQDLNIIKANDNLMNNNSTTEVYFDKNGEMTNVVRNTDNNEKNYFMIDEVDNNRELVDQEKNNSKEMESKNKVKVKTLTKPGISNLSSAFANTLILSFVIGSFFGIVFLAIYLKLMH